MTVLPFGNLPLGMKKIVLFPFGMRVPKLLASLPRSLVNYFIHISASEPCRNCLYYCDITVMISMTELASKWIHDSCAVSICVTRTYLEEFLSVMGCWKRKDFRGATCSVLHTLVDGAVVGIGDGTTLEDGAVVGICDGYLGGNVVGALEDTYLLIFPAVF